MSENDTLIVSPKRTPFIMLPVLVDDLELSPYAARLYIRIVRRAGWSGEKCWENTRHLAEACKMSAGRISQAKEELEKAGLITVTLIQKGHGEFPYHEIAIKDVWLENMQKYHQDNSTCSPGEQDRSPHEQDRSPGEPKNIPIKKSKKSKKIPVASQGLPPPIPASQEFGKNSAAASSSLRNHPAIQAVKQVTDRYPPKVIWQEIAGCLGENPDIERLDRCFKIAVAKGYNPINYDCWLFDWYPNDAHYMVDKEVLKYSDGQDG